MILNNVLPDLDFTLSNDPVACSNCVNLVTTSYNFKEMCMKKERMIRDYIKNTKSPVNLYTLVESHQDSDIPNVPKDDIKFRSEKTILSGSSIKSIFKHTLKNIENNSENYNETKKVTVKKDKDLVRNKELFVANHFQKCADINNDDNMSNVIEIVESDTDSHDGFSEDDIFTEFCSNRSKNNGSYNEFGNEELFRNIVNIKGEDCMQIVDHDIIESDDSDMIFIEEFNKARPNITYMEKIDSKPIMIKKEVNTSLFKKKSTQVDSSLSRLSKEGSRTRTKNRKKMHKKIKSNLFICVLCNKQFAQKLHMNGHLLNKHKNVPNIEKKIDNKIHYCKFCSYRTINSHNLAKHLANKHNKKNSQYKSKFKKFFCAHCEYSTENRGNLILHVRTHSLVRAFQCELCEQSYNQKVALDNHIFKTHAKSIDRRMDKTLNDKVFGCQKCNFITLVRQHYLRHLKRHKK